MSLPSHVRTDHPQGSSSHENTSSPIMGRETNMDSMRDLEKRIEEGTGDVIQLKRARNSLLNISTRVPPEILGSIFRWNVIPDEGHHPHLGGPRKGTYNFLLVCHHWFEVASCTPNLWSFWGNDLKKWSQLHKRSGTTPVDLMLRRPVVDSKTSLNGPLRDALRERAASDAIRSLHLWREERSLLTSILSALTPDDEGVRCSSIESISLRDVDPSEFFARHRFPKLWYLSLSTGVTISSWEDLGLHTTALTTLSLTIEDMSRAPTTPQLLSVLASNPRLQSLTLFEYMIPRDNGDGSTVPVLLRHLKKLLLRGAFHPVFRLLRQLDHPETMDKTRLNLFPCTVEEISGTLGPYMGDYIRRDRRFRDGLGILITFLRDSISIEASITSGVEGPIQEVTFATFTATLRDDLPPSVKDNLCIDSVAHIPREHVVYFSANLGMDAVRRIVVTMPNIQELHLTSAMLDDRFLQPDLDGPLANKKLLPSLRRLHLESTVPYDDDWKPLLSYLIHQMSGGQGISLTLSGGYQHICKDVLRDIENLVDGFVLDLDLDDDCPFDHCSTSKEGEE